MNDTVIALDIAKNVFHAVILTQQGTEIKRKKLKRKELTKFIGNHTARAVVMEACGGSHYWAREFKRLGMEVCLLPPQHVKAYLRGQKNDYNDALAIGEAYLHGRIRPVQVKSVDQQSEQSFQRIRKLLIGERGDIARQLRGLLIEFGIVLSPGITKVRKAIPDILEDGENGLPDFMRQLLSRQHQRLIQLDEEVDWYNTQLSIRAKNDEQVKRLISLPGFGPVVASAFKVWMGDGKQFSKGKYASAALGIVPRQHSSGDKTVLMGITKRGDCYLRSLVIHGARAVVRVAKTKNDKLSLWINALVERRGVNKATVALANKLVRTAWAITVNNETYRAA